MELRNQDIRLLIHFSWALGNPVVDIHAQLVRVHGGGVCSIKTVRNWVNKFETGDFDIADRPRTGRPPRDDLPSSIQQLLEENPRMSARVLAEELGENKSTICNVLKNELKMTKLSLRWVPHEPTQELMDKRFQGATDLYKRLSTLGPQQRNHVVTGDQSWVFLRNEPSKMWLKRGEEPPIRVKKSLGDEKVMMTVLFTRRVILLVDFLPIGQKYNSEYMTSVILPNLVAKIKETSPNKNPHRWFIHLDNSPVHNSNPTMSAIEKFGFTRLPHPPYSPDLAPSDFSLFGYLKNQLSLKNCTDISELQSTVREFLDNLPTNWFELVWDEWDKRLRWVIENSGKYYTK